MRKKKKRTVLAFKMLEGRRKVTSLFPMKSRSSINLPLAKDARIAAITVIM